MRNLTESEKTVRDERAKRFEAFLEERMSMMADFADRLGLENPPMIVADPASYLGPIAGFMENQEIDPEDRAWIGARIGCFVGELLIQRFGGYWFLNEIPDSKFFLRYVVGGFNSPIPPAMMVDPFEVASAYLEQPPGRSLTKLLATVERELSPPVT